MFGDFFLGLKHIVSKFKIKNKIVSVVPYGNGKINDTYLVVTSKKKKYILQKIKQERFCDIKKYVHKIKLISDYQRKNKANYKLHTIKLIATKSNKSFLRYKNNSYRVMKFIDGANISVPENQVQVYCLGYAVAEFEKSLLNLDFFPELYLENDLHNLQNHYRLFIEAIRYDFAKRVQKNQNAIKIVQKLYKKVSNIVKIIKKAKLPLRIVHNDTKLNNVIFNEKKTKIVAIVDFDNIGVGTVLNDFGDSVRSVCKVGTKPENIDFSFNYFRSYTKGYLKIAKSFLTNKEINCLHFAPLIISFELGIRFLTDYFNGDLYFKIKEENSNLINALNQFELSKIIIKNLKKLKKIVKKCEKT